jgi:pimeloyl-ACP methyl ester carboxylesterase
VAHEFHRLIGNSRLEFIDKCCHAPMMERPEEFNKIVLPFLKAC